VVPFAPCQPNLTGWVDPMTDQVALRLPETMAFMPGQAFSGEKSLAVRFGGQAWPRQLSSGTNLGYWVSLTFNRR